MRKSIIAALGFSLVATSLTACGPDESENEEITPASTQQALTQNTEAMAKGVSEAIAFLEDSELVTRALESTAKCSTTPSFDDQGNEIGGEEVCEPSTVSFDINEPSAQLTEFLKTRIFTEANVELAQPREITYLLKGANVCADMGSDKAQCEDFFDKAQLRIVATSPAPNDFNLKLLVGAAKANPITLELGSSAMAIEADLGAAKASVLTIATALGEDAPELPETMQGKVRAALNRPGAKKLEATFSVLAALKVAGADFDVQVAPTNDAVKLSIDGVAKTVDHQVNWAAINAKFPFWEYEEVVTTVTDENGDTYEEYDSQPKTKHSVQIALGGINGQALFDAASEAINLKGLGLGDTTSTVSVDGEQIVSVDLNPANGRRVDLNMREEQDSMLLEIAPALDLKVVLAFAKIQDKFTELDVQDWMLGDTLSIKADGANPVRLSMGDQLKVLAGKLTISSSAANITHTVNADQCLLETESQEQTRTDEGDSVDADAHFLSTISVQACQ